MCMMVYLGSDQLPAIIPWNEEAPAFHTKELRGEQDSVVRTKFSKTHVYYLGAHEGCGCGFSFNEYPGLVNSDEINAARISAAKLADYLESLLSSESNLELYACWDGDQQLPQTKTRTLYPSQLRQDAFWFEQRSFYYVLEGPGNSIPHSTTISRIKMLAYQLIRRWI